MEIGIQTMIWLWGGVAENNDQEISANIRKEKYIVDFNDEGGKRVDNEFYNLCNKPQLFDTTVRQREAEDDDEDNVVEDWETSNLVVGESVAEINNQANIRGEEDNVDFNDKKEKK